MLHRAPSSSLTSSGVVCSSRCGSCLTLVDDTDEHACPADTPPDHSEKILCSLLLSKGGVGERFVSLKHTAFMHDYIYDFD